MVYFSGTVFTCLFVVFYLKWSLATFVISGLCITMWFRTGLNLLKGPEKSAEVREEFTDNLRENGITIDGQRQIYVTIYLMSNNVIEFVAETINYNASLIKRLSGLAVILVISTIMNAMGDSILIWSSVISAFIITPLMINRQLRKEEENKALTRQTMQLSSTGGKIVGFIEWVREQIDMKVPKFSDLLKYKNEEMK